MSKASDEMREWAELLKCSAYTKVTAEKISAFADRIDTEMVELPKDMDGVPIYVGDTVYDENGMACEVVSFSFSRWSEGMTVHAIDGSSKRRDLMPGRLAHTAPDSFERIADELEKWCDRVDVDGDACDKPRDLADRIRKLAKEQGDE